MHDTIKVALIGQPNSGKSTFFNQLVGYRAHTSNFPGTTVEFLQAEVVYGKNKFEIIDLPGIYSLLGEEPAERVTLKYLIENKIDVIINVLDSSVLSRSLELTIEVASFKIPMILVLNMMDEAEKKGIKINAEILKEKLGIDVVETIATQGKGVDKVIKMLNNASLPKNLLEITAEFSIHQEIIGSARNLKAKHPNISEEVAKILCIADLEGQLGFLSSTERQALKQSFTNTLKIENPWLLIHQEKHKIAMALFEESTRIIHKKMKKSAENLVDSVLMNPYLGPLSALLIILLMFFLVQQIGGYLSTIFSIPFEFISQKLQMWRGNPIGITILRAINDGLNSGIGIVFPYFVPFILFISILEDVGYLSRFAFIMDHLLHRLGLHGKSTVPFILGYGCNVPAVFSTRIIESDRERITTAFLIPFIPCSARLAIIFALSTLFLGFRFAFFLFILNLVVIAIIAKLISHIFKSDVTDFILEIPPYRIPTLKGLFSKLWFKLKDFITFAWPVIIAGSIILALMQYFKIDVFINRAFSPFLKNILGLNPNLGLVLIFGVLRKELALIMASEALKTPVPLLNSVLSIREIATFTVFVTFYTPCLSTILALWKETGLKWTLLQIASSLFIATILAVLTGIAFSF